MWNGESLPARAAHERRVGDGAWGHHRSQAVSDRGAASWSEFRNELKRVNKAVVVNILVGDGDRVSVCPLGSRSGLLGQLAQVADDMLVGSAWSEWMGEAVGRVLEGRSASFPSNPAPLNPTPLNPTPLNPTPEQEFACPPLGAMMVSGDARGYWTVVGSAPRARS